MSIDNHKFSDGDVKLDVAEGEYIQFSVTSSAIGFTEADVKAMAVYMGLLPEPKTPEEVADIERLVASSSRLNNGG